MIFTSEIHPLLPAEPSLRKRVVVWVLLCAVLFVMIPVTGAGHVAVSNQNQIARSSFTPTSPAAAWEHVNKARRAGAADRHEDSIRWYLKAVAQHPPLKIKLAREIAYQYSRHGKPDLALTWYKTSLAFYPNDVESHLGLARALSRSGRYEEALARYRAVLPACERLPLDVELEVDRVAARLNER